MDRNRRIFDHRTFVSMMAGLMGIILFISGPILHTYSHQRAVVGGHVWFTIHVFSGILFLITVGWHIFLNRRVFLKHLKSGAAGSLPISREACLAIAITVTFLIMIIVHSV